MRKNSKVNEYILTALIESRGSYISGEELSKRINISRTAIWKHIKELKNQGYSIDSVTNKGYSLISSGDVLSSTSISAGLDTMILGKNIEIHKTIDSTNIRAKVLAAQGCNDGYVVISEEQIAGRGRMGKEWSSLNGKGLWMSVIFTKPMTPEITGLITLGVSLAVVEALNKNLGEGFGIKWPNDIIAGGKKLCGILCEMSTEADAINHVIVGLGLNISQENEDFKEELSSIATSLKQLFISQNRSIPEKYLERSFWAAEIINELERVYFILLDHKGCGIIDRWKKHCLTINKEVKVFYKEESIEGMAIDVNSDGELLVLDRDGNVKTIRSGEARVRGLMGYV